MNKLYNKLKKYSISDSIKFEEKDRQYLALKTLYENKKINNENYLFLIIANALICYQLSGKGEEYWEEFSVIIKDKNFNNFLNIYNFFEKFIPESKNNRRFIDTKLKRIKKLDLFYEIFFGKTEYYYKNMENLVLDLSKTMNQKTDAKTIVFAVKMFSYGARNIYDFEYFSDDIMIPIDSRLENLYKKYNPLSNSSPHPNPLLKERGQGQKINDKSIKEFYINLSKKLRIPLLHLDAILWVNYDELIKT